ncbi:alpha/beta hydrolase [Clostridium polyendosporum]|uniref:Alpha/beta hydrolase n=1 Tax=Clostridium polyendosporum TaxID=69208 RepID=A0A919S089_9CLOT|nr:alpha/beta hydrolase [Clostridium polyendosporum]GIM29044.1 alpha/beta hydrolase [Clostridium polyendosporum]
MKKFLKTILGILATFVVLILIINIVVTKRVELSYNDEPENQIAINNTNIHYRATGNELLPPLLLIHGYQTSSEIFSEILPSLSEKYRVIAIDLIGFGLSDKSPNLDYSDENIANLCNKFMKRLGYDKYYVLGHSAGGEVALSISTLFPEKVQKLVLVDIVEFSCKQYLGIPPSFFANISPLLLKEASVNYLGQLIFYSQCFFNKDYIDFDFFEKNLYYNRKISKETLSAISKIYCSEMGKEHAINVKSKTLILWGVNDKIATLDNGYKLNDQIKDSSLVIFQNCGHIPFIEARDSFLSALFKFLG